MSDRAITLISRALLALSLMGITAFGQLEFSKPKPIKPLPNPSLLGSPRDEVVSITKQMLETREIPIIRNLH
ncbi:MAG: hypothetical protein DMF60_13110 [Acidobacteria bacterium]|nr:MAG: hypothetical protein DMF60_13110 [Acidobacteriota bacterium]